MSNNNCIMPEVRKNVWVVYDTQGNKLGEVGAMTEIEAVHWTIKRIHGSFEIFEIAKDPADTSQRWHRRVVWV